MLPSNPPFFHVGSGLAGDYQPVPGCIVELVKDSNSGWVDRDTCGNFGCSFAGNEAPNALLVDRWDASASGGQFGSLDANGQFTPIQSAPGGYYAWGDVTHYKTPSSPMSVTLTLRLRDNPNTYEPNGTPVTTIGGETTQSTRTLNVGFSTAGTWDAYTLISGGSISQPAAGGYYGWAADVPCGANSATDSDRRTNTGTGCAQSILPDTVTYTWSATGGSFPSGNTGENVTWRSPNVDGTYTLTLSVDDQNNANKPSTDSGSRNDDAVEFTRTVTVKRPSWEVFTAISGGGIFIPADMARVQGGGDLACGAFKAFDDDKQTASDGTVATMPDTPTYTWTATVNGSPVGSFPGGNTGQNVTWRAPSMGGGMVELAVTIDDQNDTNKPANEGGTRDDMRDPPLKFTRNVVYHAHSFTTTGNTANQTVELRHINGSTAEGGVTAGEILELRKGLITPDRDFCVVDKCNFSTDGIEGLAEEDLPRHTTVSLADQGTGIFGKLSPDGETFTATSDPDEITHYRVNPTLTGGTIEVWANVDDAAVAIDQDTMMDVPTKDDGVVDGTPHFTAPVSTGALWEALHRRLDPDDACGCPVCGEPGNSTIDPRTGAVAFEVPVSGYEFRGVDLGLSFSYNSNAKADPRFDSPNLPGVDPAGDLARMSQRNSRWTHNWAQAIEVVSDGVLQRAIWHTGGGTVGFERTSEGLWISGDSDHKLISGGTTLTNIRVYGNHSSGGEQVEDERLVQTVLPYSWFELQSGDGTVHRFETPVWQKGTGAAVAYFPLQRTRDRWGLSRFINPDWESFRRAARI